MLINAMKYSTKQDFLAIFFKNIFQEYFSRIFFKNILSFKDRMKGVFVLCVAMDTGYDPKGPLIVQW